MIKGCAKRVVVVRNMDSNLFEEAFFIVKAGQGAKKSTEEEFLGEAERLVKTTPVQSSVDSGTDTPAQARFRIAPKNASVSAGVPLGGSLAAFGDGRSTAPKKTHLLHLRDVISFAAGCGVGVCGMLLWMLCR
ncbi:MAG: hypothetical protein ACOYIO_09790 [Eubacteriales bacterium]|jgi:hypothetical protein